MDRNGSRRRFLLAMAAIAAGSSAARGAAQVKPFELTLKRDRNLPATLNLNDCVTGKLYAGAGSLSDPGTFLCDTLELPFRNEQDSISCIKPGSYSGFVKTEPTDQGVALGWRIQLTGTKQTAIQIHTGNITDHTRGCILIGTRAASPCALAAGSSRPARDNLLALHGSGKRTIRVNVLN